MPKPIAILPVEMVSSFNKELKKIHQKAGRLDSYKEAMSEIKDQGEQFLLGLVMLYNIMEEEEADLFKPLFAKAAMVIANPTHENQMALRDEMDVLKKNISAYKKMHPYSSGLGFIFLSGLAVILGVSLMIAGIALTVALAPGLAIELAVSVLLGVAAIAFLTSLSILCDGAEMHYKFFNDTYQNKVERLVESIASERYREMVSEMNNSYPDYTQSDLEPDFPTHTL
jgi:hypothetical protein